MAEPCYVRITRSAGLLWLRIRLWYTNRDSAGVGFNKEVGGSGDCREGRGKRVIKAGSRRLTTSLSPLSLHAHTKQTN